MNNGDLISREALLAKLWKATNGYRMVQEKEAVKNCILEVKDAPAVDAVEVVRCSKCKYGEIDDPDFPNQYLCHYDGNSWNNGEHFCGYGERKEGAD